MNEETLVKVLATREGGAVRRCHIVPHHGEYNNAQHSYNAASLLMILNGVATPRLIRAVLWHDVGERWLGDMPAPAKWGHEELGQAYERAEESILRTLGLHTELDEHEQNWLKAVDTLELWMWSREEEAKGNGYAGTMARVCERTMDARIQRGEVPIQAQRFYDKVRKRPHQRLSDVFEEAVHGLFETEEGLEGQSAT